MAESTDFSALHERMQWYVDEGILPCCATLVLKGQTLLDHQTFGYMDLESRIPLRRDAIYRMYSNTKLVTSVAAMMLWEAGRFDLDDPLADYLPQFGQLNVLKADAQRIDQVTPAREPLRIRHLLSHTAGFSYGFIEPESVLDQAYMAHGLMALDARALTLESLCEGLAELPLAFEPGSRWRYSLATDVLARLIEVLSGERFDAHLQRVIFEPLGMVDTDFHVPPEKQDRFITQYAPTDPFNPMAPGLVAQDAPATGRYARPPSWLSGGGGLVSTVDDYLKFLRVIIGGGQWQDVRLLQPETLARMTRNVLPAGRTVEFPFWDMADTGFGLGFAVKAAPAAGEPAAARGEFHWGGMAGTHTWIAPAAGLTGFCLTQRMPGFWHPFSHEFKRLAYQLAG